MDSKIVLAVAGSGKTYYIANSFDENNRVLLLSFTNRNTENIKQEIIKRFQKVPEEVKIHTFDSFVYNFLIRPFEPMLNFKDVRSLGVEVVIQPETKATNPNYIKNDNIKHYMKDNRYYVSRLSKLFIKQCTEYKEHAVKNVEKYFDIIFVDEFQDYNGNDFKLIKILLDKFRIPIIAVGDIFQSNVTPIRNDGVGSSSPFDKIKSAEGLYTIGKINKSIPIDQEILKRSRRVPENVCSFIRNNLNIEIYSCSDKEGKVQYIDDMSKINKILKDENTVKLFWNKRVYAGVSIPNTINWSYSKGDTYENVCIILTRGTSDSNNWNNLAPGTRNKLYVALTRSKKNVYLIKDTDFKKWKEVN